MFDRRILKVLQRGELVLQILVMRVTKVDQVMEGEGSESRRNGSSEYRKCLTTSDANKVSDSPSFM